MSSNREEGKKILEINPHIPQYIAQAPWYLQKDEPGLNHQRASKSKPDYDQSWYSRGQKGQSATKWRKGACQNCGAMTHKTKECCERPRKIGAKWTGKDIRPDEVIQDLLLDYDGKRDRWNGYDAAEHNLQMEEFEKAELERRKKRKEEELNRFMTEKDDDYNRYPIGSDKVPKKPETLVESDSESGSDADEEKKDFIDQGDSSNVGVKKDPKTRTTIRNLRIREDTAKYLKDLDTESVFYDPKSRSMRDTEPIGVVKTEEGIFYQLDNFAHATGDAIKFNEMQKFAWNSYETGNSIHLTAAPSQAELAYQQAKTKKDVITKEQRDAILAKYGGKEHLEAPPKELLLAQTEQFVTYTSDGSILRGKDKLIPRSKYDEDIYINNHKSVWGSFWEKGLWGYSCCNQFVKNSYCTGKAGIEVKDNIQKEIKLRTEESFHEVDQETKEKGKKLEKALIQEDYRQKQPEEKDDRKRGYNSSSSITYDVSPEEMEAYRLKKQRSDDPMQNFK
jgi:pre-mRNA-processing factor SLU7